MGSDHAGQYTFPGPSLIATDSGHAQIYEKIVQMGAVDVMLDVSAAYPDNEVIQECMCKFMWFITRNEVNIAPISKVAASRTLAMLRPLLTQVLLRQVARRATHHSSNGEVPSESRAAQGIMRCAQEPGIQSHQQGICPPPVAPLSTKRDLCLLSTKPLSNTSDKI